MIAEKDILKICEAAGWKGGELLYGGFADGKYYVSYGGKSEDGVILLVGAPVILIVENGVCRVATDDERVYFYTNFVKD